MVRSLRDLDGIFLQDGSGIAQSYFYTSRNESYGYGGVPLLHDHRNTHLEYDSRWPRCLSGRIMGDHRLLYGYLFEYRLRTISHLVYHRNGLFFPFQEEKNVTGRKGDFLS